MSSIKQFVSRFAQDESGQNLIEYALVACLIGLGAIAALTSVSNAVQNSFQRIGLILSQNL